MAEYFSELWSTVVTTFMGISFTDVLDIAVVSVLIYALIKIIRDTRAAQLLRGILLAVAILWLSKLLNLTASEYILNSALEFGVLALLIVFHPEIRSILERLGRKGFNKFPLLGQEESTEAAITVMIANVTKAVSYFATTKTGALIVIERETKLGDIIKDGKGITVNSDTTPELIMNIFFNKAPLHDGAMIIRSERIAAAGCFLPLSTKAIDSELGTRHRAGLGVSEVSDAIVIIVSEETGIISLAVEGKLTRRLTPDVLSSTLKKLLIPEDDKKKRERLTGLLKGKGK